MSDDVNQTDKKPHKESHKLGADRHDPARNPGKEHGGHKTSKDIREDRGIRKHKLGKHKN